MHNWATCQRLIAVTGYDPLVQASKPNVVAYKRFSKAPLQAAREYGVRWFAVHSTCFAPVFSDNPKMHQMEIIEGVDFDVLEAVLTGTVKRGKGDVLDVWEMANPRPLAFSEAAPDRSLPLVLNAAGAVVNATPSPEGGRIVLNFLWRKDWQGAANGVPVPVSADEWGRLVADVPPGTTSVAFRYAPPWERGFLAAAGLFLTGGLTFAGLFFWCRERPGEKGGAA
jgi:hypothetical protein